MRLHRWRRQRQRRQRRRPVGKVLRRRRRGERRRACRRAGRPGHALADGRVSWLEDCPSPAPLLPSTMPARLSSRVPCSQRIDSIASSATDRAWAAAVRIARAGSICTAVCQDPTSEIGRRGRRIHVPALQRQSARVRVPVKPRESLSLSVRVVACCRGARWLQPPPQRHRQTRAGALPTPRDRPPPMPSSSSSSSSLSEPSESLHHMPEHPNPAAVYTTTAAASSHQVTMAAAVAPPRTPIDVGPLCASTGPRLHPAQAAMGGSGCGGGTRGASAEVSSHPPELVRFPGTSLTPISHSWRNASKF